MAQRVQILCINKTNRYDPYDRIARVGGTNADGTRWSLTVADAIAGIEGGKWSFYVSRGGHTVDVIVSSRNGVKYLKTTNDGDHPDNLLALPECP